MQFRDLQIEDAARLLAFELANKDWFEKSVEARKDEFYTVAGTLAHIRECLDAYTAGTMHPCVLVDGNGDITGRLNLRFIDPAKGSGEIGYRIGELHCGKGWASASVIHMQQLAYGKWGLRELVAYVNVENPASVRVLEKNGFVRQEFVPERSFVQQRKIDGYRYLHTAA